MRRRWRRLIWIPIGLLLLLFLLPFVVPADRWKQIAIDQLKARTGWEASAGSARISIFPLGVRISELAVDDPDGDKGYERFSLRADAVVLRADLVSVLKRAPKLEEIRLVKPAMELWAKAKTDSVTSPDSSAVAPSPAAPPAPSSISSLLAFVAIEDGSFTLHDAERSLNLIGLRQRIELSLAGPTFRAQVEGEMAGGEWADAQMPRSPLALPALKLTGVAQGSIDGGSLQVDPLRVESLGQIVQGKLELSGAEAKTLGFALESSGELSQLYTALREQFPLGPELSSLVLEGGALQWALSTARPLPLDAKPDAMLQALHAQGSIGTLQAELWQERAVAEQTKFSLSEGRLRVSEMQLTLPGARCEMELSGPLGPEQTLTLATKLRGDLRALRALAARVLPQLPQELVAKLPPLAKWPGVAGMLSGDIEVELPQKMPADPRSLTLLASLQLSKVGLLPAAWRDSLLVPAGAIMATATEARLSEFQLSGPGFAGKASGSVWGWPDGIESEWDLAMNSVDLDQMQMALAPPLAEKAFGPEWFSRPAHAATVAAELPVPPANLGADVRLTVQELRTRGYRLANVDGRASLHERKLAVTQTSAKLGSGELALVMDVDWNRTPAEWNGKTTAHAVPAAELVRPFASILADALSTTFDGDIALNGPLSLDRAQILAALTGNAALQSAAGALTTEPLFGEALKTFLGDHYARFRELDFRALTAGVTVSGGQVRFDRFLLDGTTQLRANGQVGLDGSCDYSLDVLLPAGLTPKLGDLAPLAELLRDGEGRFGFRVNVDGPARKPKVAVDFDQLASLAGERAKQKAAGELDRLLERGMQAASRDSSSSDSTNVIEQKGREAVESLLDRFRKKKGKGAP